MVRRGLAFLSLALGLAAAGLADNHNVAVGPGNTFTPANVNIHVGDSVTWTLMGGSHNVVADTHSKFRSGPVGSSWPPFTHTFQKPEVVVYYCEAHGGPGGAGMAGTVTVQEEGGGAPGALRFTGNASRSVGEGTGNMTITVQRTGGDEGAVSVQYETVNGSASQPGDYTQANGTLSWPDHNDDNMTFQVPIINDGDVEPNEQFTIRLQNPTGGATLASPNLITVTINDNDAPQGGAGTLRFTSATRNAGEGDADVSLTVERVGGSTGAVSVHYATANGSATSGSDYVDSTGTLSWAGGDSANKFIEIPIVGDTVEELSETFSVALSAPTGGAAIGSPGTATVTIADDDLTCVPCVSDATTLCLAGGSGDPSRFRVKVTWHDFAGGSGPGMAVPFTSDSGFFYFFSPTNLELLAKMVNGCGTVFDAYWFFYAAASNVGLDYQVVDTLACQQKTYTNPLGNFASDGDINALPTCASNPALAPEGAPASLPMVTARPARVLEAPSDKLSPAAGEGGLCLPCVSDDTTLCLAGGSGDPNRFQVRVTWTDFQGGSGPGMAVPFTADSGFFYFFSPTNLELLAKMVNGCGSQFDAYWFFYAAASNVGLHYEVVDTTACVTKTYDNPVGNFASDGDINALPTCSANFPVQP